MSPTTPTPDLTTPVYLVRRSFFWQIHTVQNTVNITHGRGCGQGRTSTKTFPSPSEASLYAKAAISNKRKAGYHDPKGPVVQTAPAPVLRRSTRKRAPPSPFGSAAKRANTRSTSTKAHKIKRGLRGVPAVPVTGPLGVVDPSSELSGLIYVDNEDEPEPLVYDVMLALIDLVKNHDKYIVLQLVVLDDDTGFTLYERWGRTGRAGCSISQSFGSDKLEEAVAAFAKKFRQKTGLKWGDNESGPVTGKYRVVKQDFVQKYHASVAVSDKPLWQYWVDDGVDGKELGWYDYDNSGNMLVEQLYTEYLSNLWLVQRVVQSGVYSYLVDLSTMMQTNIVHSNHTRRHIRRLDPNDTSRNTPPISASAGTHSHFVGTVTAFMPAKKPNVLPAKVHPAHKVQPALAAVVPSISKAKADAKDEQVLEEDHTAAESEMQIPVDNACPNADQYKVVQDFDATLNQTNIMGGNNNNKYYRLQLIQKKVTLDYCVWMRWGRVGESRGVQAKLLGPFKQFEKAEKLFQEKFRSKTKNSWSNRAEFVPVSGKYDLVEIDHTQEKKEEAEPLTLTLKPESDVEYLPSTLPKETRELIELLFEKDVYTDALKAFDIDVRKMPLGALSTAQIEKGVVVLENIEDKLKSGTGNRLEYERLSSKFYTTLPHDFGRRRPPVINDQTILQHCYDMCNVLLDMEKATILMAEAMEKNSEQKEKRKVPHPTEAQYASLNAKLDLVQPGSDEHDVVAAAFNRTKGSCGSNNESQLLNVWRVNRNGEADRFKQVQHLKNHLLLWHGSHIGAISAILATGLRIMPHSGGRVGRGIYLASENGKSQCYTTPASRNNVGCMFLAEAALGKAKEILEDNSSLTKPPKGFDSVHACGQQTPAGFRTIALDNVSVRVPVQEPKENPKARNSSFFQDEYLIYNEAQARIRYIITMRKASYY